VSVLGGHVVGLACCCVGVLFVDHVFGWAYCWVSVLLGWSCFLLGVFLGEHVAGWACCLLVMFWLGVLLGGQFILLQMI
jgi:hypothetical protein